MCDSHNNGNRSDAKSCKCFAWRTPITLGLLPALAGCQTSLATLVLLHLHKGPGVWLCVRRISGAALLGCARPAVPRCLERSWFGPGSKALVGQPNLGRYQQ